MADIMKQADDLLIASEAAPGGIIVYYADGDEQILHANQYVIDLCECDSFEDFLRLTDGSFKGFVHSNDFASAEDNIWGQVKELNGFDHIYYQVRTKSGRLVSVDDYGRLVRREGQRPVFVVFLVELDRRGSIDWLTGLPGMERFEYLMSYGVVAAAERGEELAFVAFDLMGMRFYNARHGREKGDELICAFADILRARFGSDTCCRSNGDSFFAYARKERVEELMQGVFDDFAHLDELATVPVMAGVTVHEQGDSFELSMDRARYACYTDSSTWESHYTWYTNEMRTSALMRVYVLEHVDEAIEKGWIRPYYQSVVRPASGAVCHEEALARWIDPEHGFLSPAQFVPVLEEAGLLLKIDFHIIDCVLADMRERRSRGIPVVPVSVNISPRDLSKASIAQEVSRRADAAGVSHSLLRIEFTESAASSDPELLREQIRDLHRAGFEVWMDDFGSGYSSLNSLGEFDFDCVKLDMGLIMQQGSMRRDIIIDATIRAAKRMGLATLAEGIETDERAAALTEMGCEMLQGYRYSRPRPLAELIDEFETGRALPHEQVSEEAYWKAVSAVSLSDLASNGEGKGVSEMPVVEFPAGVLEWEDGVWRSLRANASLRSFLEERSVIPPDSTAISVRGIPVKLDEKFGAAARRSDASGSWERISGVLEQGSGFQFHVCLLVTCERARAYVVVSMPTLLGSALGAYGDVPVAYAVLRAVLSEDESEAVNLEYIFANDRYRDWSGLGPTDFTGLMLLDFAGEQGQRWLAPCYRAAVKGEKVHEVVYSPSAGHWISIDIAPTPIPAYCVFAFTLADAEHAEREELYRAGTYDALTGLYNRRGFDEALAERMYENVGKSFALALVDVDDLEAFNALYGRDAGDAALRTVADVLQRAFPPGTLIGRNGRGEMAIAVFGHAVRDMEYILGRLTDSDLHCEVGGRRHRLSLSGGYTWCDGTSRGLKAAYTRASQALAEVRRAGQSGYLKWVPAMEEGTRRKLLGFTTKELAESMPLAMVAHRQNGEILVASKGLARLLGYPDLSTALVASGHNLLGFIHPDDRSRMEETFASLADAGPSEDERTIGLRVRMAEGSVMQVAYRARVAEGDGDEVLFYAYMVDTLVAG